MKISINSLGLTWPNGIGLLILGSISAGIPLSGIGLHGFLQSDSLLAQTSQSTVEVSGDTRCQGNECADPVDRAWAKKDGAGAGSNSADGSSSSGGASSSGGGASSGGGGGNS